MILGFMIVCMYVCMYGQTQSRCSTTWRCSNWLNLLRSINVDSSTLFVCPTRIDRFPSAAYVWLPDGEKSVRFHFQSISAFPPTRDPTHPRTAFTDSRLLNSFLSVFFVILFSSVRAVHYITGFLLQSLKRKSWRKWPQKVKACLRLLCLSGNFRAACTKYFVTSNEYQCKPVV